MHGYRMKESRDGPARMDRTGGGPRIRTFDLVAERSCGAWANCREIHRTGLTGLLRLQHAGFRGVARGWSRSERGSTWHPVLATRNLQ
jgi:hypothetical protein